MRSIASVSRPADLPAGGHGDGADPHEVHAGRPNTVFGGHRRQQTAAQGVEFGPVLAAVAHLGDDHDVFLGRAPDPEGDRPVDGRMGAVDRALDVLRVEVPAGHHEQTAYPAGDEQFPVAQIAEVTGPQIRPRTGAVSRRRAERRAGQLGFAMVAGGDVGAMYPDLSDLADGQHPAGVRIDDKQLVALRRAPATDNGDRMVHPAHHPATRQLLPVHPLDADGRLGRFGRHEQRGLGEPVTRDQCLLPIAPGREPLPEGVQSLEHDRLRATEDLTE
ncbi:hypothetical protein JK363_30880 [Streptomyces sp. 205]|uniref:Uncharacterized protein n=1 Tax=Streptomyces coffeae TaxID=621382 RepID=A0ABS1NLS0_9ACTN|nr:hypothetical protein [Streptomyces coffeae]MBL1100996.1 hypothetical protein [Streptomyces coffeae]